MPSPITCIRVAAWASLLSLPLSALAGGSTAAVVPTFTNVTVHDPSVVRDGHQFYVFGSHLASARTSDGLHWTQLSAEPVPGNPLFPDPQGELAEAIAWVGGENAFWAPDVIRLPDGRYAYYYCIGRLDQPRAVLGMATADTITGPYQDQGILLRSGMWGEISPDGTVYDATRHPNAVDPDVFFDRSGRLWMVYGSYSGGIFILELDPVTGQPLSGQGYGKKLIGGHHARIEGGFMLYSPESRYYYLFLSFGGLAPDGGYNLRVARSRQPDGPFLDAAGNDLTNVAGTPGTLFDDAAIAPYGVKLFGNYQFLSEPGEPAVATTGYVSPGHNSAYYDPHTGRHFVVFHTRFVGRGEAHEVRVHEFRLNADGWPVVAPHRFAGGYPERLNRGDAAGDYKLIQHGKAISADVNVSRLITLRPNGTVTGALVGTWRWDRENEVTLTLDGSEYQGVFSTEWDDDQGAWVRSFSALSSDGAAIWGSRVVIARQDPRQQVLPDRLALFSTEFSLRMPAPSGNPRTAYSYSLLAGPSGLVIDRAMGVLTWQPTLTQVEVPSEVTVLALDPSPDHPRQTHYTFTLTARSQTIVRRAQLEFDAPAPAGLLDALGQPTGFTARLAGTGGSLPVQDPRLLLAAEEGVLELTSTQADFFGQVGLAQTSAPGINLAALGFTGSEDFSVTVDFRPLTGLEFIDQVGLYVAAHSNLLTRAGTIVWGEPERYSTHTRDGADVDARFFGFGLNVTDGLTVTIAREGGTWRYFVDGAEWNPLTAPGFLDGRADLVAGVFAITPLNANAKAIDIDRFSAVVATNEPQLSALEAWRIRYFHQLEATGVAADRADPDRDRRSNRQEFENGTNPLDVNSR